MGPTIGGRHVRSGDSKRVGGRLQNQHDKQNFGEALGDFSLAAINGGTVSLSQRLEGKKAGVVLFWSGVCSHCERYDQYLNQFERQHPEIALIGVASRHGETVEMIQK